MEFNWHYIKNNDYPTDDYEKLLIVKDSLSDIPPLIGFSYIVAYWRANIKSWDSYNLGFIENEVVAWCELPTNLDINLKEYL